MRWEALNDNCTFAYLPALEPLFGVYSLLSGEQAHQLCTALYGEGQIAAWRRRYRFLFETLEAVKALSPFSLFDFLLDTLAADFCAADFRDYLLSLPEAARVFRLAEWGWFDGVTPADIQRALSDDAALDALYARVEDKCPSFLGFSCFVRQSARCLEAYFALAAELDTPALHEALQAQEKNIDAFRARVLDHLAAGGLECSQTLMGKTFRNRGPYEQFFFLPSLLLPCSSLRFFYDNGTPHNRQILICSIREPEKGPPRTTEALKALSDETRYRILLLLAAHGSVNGQQIARSLQLAPSTVSHHMNELRDAGLITEEAVKTAKFYGLAKNTLQRLLDDIQRDLKLP